MPTSLEVLFLDGTKVTDAGLVHEGVKELQHALPNCQILHQPLPLTHPGDPNTKPTTGHGARGAG